MEAPTVQDTTAAEDFKKEESIPSSAKDNSRSNSESQPNDQELQQLQHLQALLLQNPQLALEALGLSGPLPSLALALQQQQQQQQQQLALLQSATHNLIPLHLRASALAASLSGTPGYPSALIPLAASQQPHNNIPQPQILTPLAVVPDPIPPPILTVQDRPMTPPVYNGVNPNYPGLRVLNTSPPIFAVDNFLTPHESDFLIQVAQDSFGPAPVVGKGTGQVSPSRTSSTCYLAREDLPDLMRKVSLLTGKPPEHCELPQVGRYFPSQQYLQHYDAFDLATEDGLRFAANGGQRTITVLLYLNDVMRGGATRFPTLNMEVQPRRGMALVFFPATVDGLLDKMALHAAMPAIDTKYVSQLWIRQSNYNGQPSKRLPQTLGAPFLPHELSGGSVTATAATNANNKHNNSGTTTENTNAAGGGGWKPAQPLQY